ncbi:MAG: hypothetical protein JWR33_1032 [Naasia sp.]|jgi:hypothetical protein|uniref:hypothetical protein n=1 Tax=Naasia sp. TaxID=2546198 RepID=UPI0026129931|nr:hypothetical protein [Naasia sp.]MCU1570291.1 hypothetical protein [Naasia sp.]
MTRELPRERLRDWTLPVLRGLLAGILALVITFSADHTPAFGLGIWGSYALLQGLMVLHAVPRSSEARGSDSAAALGLASGIVGLASGVAAGAVVIAAPGAALSVLVPLIAVSAAVLGGIEVAAGIRSGPAGRDAVTVGGATVLLAALLAFVPAGPVVWVGLLGAYGAVVAVFLLIAGLSLKWDGSTAPARKVPSA